MNANVHIHSQPTLSSTKVPVGSRRSASASVTALLPQVVLAFDAAPGRESIRDAVKNAADALFTTMPKGLTVQLAVNGGSRLHTITRPTKVIGTLKGQICGIRCQPGQSQITQVLEWARSQPKAASAVIIFAERFEEIPEVGCSLADTLRARGTTVIIIHDPARCSINDAVAFGEIANRAGGCVVPIDAADPAVLRDIFGSVAALAVGGHEALQSLALRRPAVRHLLSRWSAIEPVSH